MVQWLRIYSPSARDPGSIPDLETGFHVPQLKVHMSQLILSAPEGGKEQAEQTAS